MTIPTNQDYELFRIWDSCELEDFEENTHEYGFKFDSVNSEEQTGVMMMLSLTYQVMWIFNTSTLLYKLSLKSIIYIYPYHLYLDPLFLSDPVATARKSLLAKDPASSSLMLANPPKPDGQGGGGNVGNVPQEAEPKKKPKKEVSLNRKAASTVSGLSSKVTDIRCLLTQLDNSEL